MRLPEEDGFFSAVSVSGRLRKIEWEPDGFIDFLYFY